MPYPGHALQCVQQMPPFLWDAGLAFGDLIERWRVRAMPGNRRDVAARDHFRMSVNAR